MLKYATEGFVAATGLDFRTQRIFEFVGPFIPSSARLCDVGCYDGTLTEKLPGREKVGVDGWPDALAVARQRGLTAVQHDLDSDAPWPFENGRFDVVCAFDTLEHCLRTDHVLNEINRLLRKDGVFLCSVPNVNQLASLWFYLRDLPPASSAKYRSVHYRDFTRRTMTLALNVHGFDILRCEGGGIDPFHNRLSIGLARLWPRLSGTLMFATRKRASVAMPDGYCPDTADLLKFAAEASAPTEAVSVHPSA